MTPREAHRQRLLELRRERRYHDNRQQQGLKRRPRPKVQSEYVATSPGILQKVALGLHPESFLTHCDLCGKSTAERLKQYGRWMGHPQCYARSQDYVSWQRPPLDYEAERQFPDETAGSLFRRMKQRLERERTEILGGVSLWT